MKKATTSNPTSAFTDKGYRRREFLRRMIGASVVSVAGLPIISGRNGEASEAEKPCAFAAARKEAAASPGLKRRDEAYKIRQECAVLEKDQPIALHPDNGDEALFANKIGNYSKGLPHNEVGEVDLNAYEQMVAALKSGDPAEFEAIPVTGTLKLSDPQASYVFELEGADSHRLGMALPPVFNSAWQSDEMVELYWHALARDVPFINYGNDPLIGQAASDLSAMSDFRGPKIDKKVTRETLFRGETPGDLSGPYISQFLWRDVPWGATPITQRYRTTLPGDDHMTEYMAWLKIQNGMPPTTTNKFDPTLRYIRNGRDLGEFVHRDFTYQAFLNACLILLSFGPASLDPANPYRTSTNQEGFVTFGAPHILDLVARVSNAALRASWCQKWLVHRRLRPEEFAGRVQNRVAGMANLPTSSDRVNFSPIHPDVFTSQGASKVFGQTGSFLLPQAYAEGAPAHPSYPAGHGAIAGACTTVLKAYFKESFIVPNSVQASTDGLVLLSYSGPRLTIGGELNKLAANMSFGRNFAGVHWRSDVTESLKLGEAVAINILQNVKVTCNKNFAGFPLTKFDGTTVTI